MADYYTGRLKIKTDKNKKWITTQEYSKIPVTKKTTKNWLKIIKNQKNT
jgi:hypothetical protein